jgi:DNA-binding transcriptional ArsR family regulator
MTMDDPGTEPHAAAAVRRAGELAETFKMLGNANRIKILACLGGGERSVSALEETLQIHQPTLSQQLGELRDAGLIVGRREAKSAFYALTDERGRRALAALYLAGGYQAPAAALPRQGAAADHAAVFASVLTARGAGLRTTYQENE